jgi:hypothetical protein
MSGVADHLSNRINQWLERVENAGADSKMLLQGWALHEIAASSPLIQRRNDACKRLIDRLQARLGEMPPSVTNPSVIGEYVEHTLADVQAQTTDPDDAFFSVLEALVVAQKRGANGSTLFNWAVTNLGTFEEAAGLAEQEMQGAMRLGRWPAVFCASVARTAWEEHADEDEEPVGAFEPIEVFARRGREQWITLRELTNRLAGVSWWCLKSDFRRLRISIELKASQLRLEVYEGEMAEGKTSRSLDGTAVRGRFGKGEEAIATIEKGVARLRVPQKVDAQAFELRVNRGGGDWVEIYGSEAAGA